jgi:multiple sugar transport system permease protein
MMRRLRREAFDGYLFASPWIVGFFVFTLGPMLASVLLSFTKWDGITPVSKIQWVGAQNYGTLVGGDELFWKCLFNTAFYVVFSVPLGTLTALGLAVLLNQPVRGIALFRTVFYLPSIVSGVATAMLWTWLLNPSFGVLNFVLSKVTGVPMESLPKWLVDENWAKPGFVLMSLWGVGNGMLIYLAGLQNVPGHLMEAAELDGASVWTKFRTVTIPHLTPTIFFNIIMGIIGSFQTFTASYIMTNGGPNNASLFYVLYLYRKAFEQFQMGYASAMAWILFVIILSLTLLVIKSSALWVYYEGERGRG